MEKFAWEPYGDYLKNSRIRKFMRLYGINTWQELIRRSTKNLEWFWPSTMDFLGVEWFTRWHTLYDRSDGMPWTKWFLGGKTNIVHNCLDRHMKRGFGKKTALIFEQDDGTSEKISFKKLHNTVCLLVRALQNRGVKKGDRVAMCMSISPEAVAVMFAAFKLGAICVMPAARISPDEMASCLNDAKPKIIFMDDGYFRGGKAVRLTETYEAIRRKVESLELIVVLEHFWDNFWGLNEKTKDWDIFLKWQTPHKKWGELREVPETTELDAEDPALILYSSGTTGKSKVIIHTHGGILAQVPKEVGFAFDCREDDIFYWFTNIGWMMAPWEIIGALFFGATVVLYEGTHLYPTPHRIFELLEKHKVTIFGFTPAGMRSLKKTDEDFSEHDLSALRVLGSTGEVLDPETWNWYFRTFGKSRLPIMNIIGGTELIGCHLSPLPIMPQNPGTVGAAGLGMDVDTVDDQGNPIRGRPGHLVCRKPFPSMTRGFLGDPQKFLDTYFGVFPNTWFHGDLAEIREDGLWYMRGREGDLIIRAGVKHDPAKIEASLMAFPEPPKIIEAAVIGADDPELGQNIIVFIVTRENEQLTPEILQRLREHVGKTLDPMAKPDVIYAVSGLPKNLAAKIPRALIKKFYQGECDTDLSKIDNPQTLEEIRHIGEKVRSSII